MASVKWQGADDIQRNLDVYASKIHQAVRLVGEYFAPVVENAAKTNASWTDRTGAARQGLHGFVEDVSESVVLLVLAHGVDYGIFLELKHQGRYAIILPTLEESYPKVMEMLREVFR